MENQLGEIITQPKSPAVNLPEALFGQPVTQIKKESVKTSKTANDIRTWEDILSLPTLPGASDILEERKSAKGRISRGIKKESKKLFNEQFDQLLTPNDEGNVDRTEAVRLAARLKAQSKSKEGEALTDNHILADRLAKMLEFKIRRAEEINARAMMEASNSPWILAEKVVIRKLSETGISEKTASRSLTQAVRRHIAEIEKITNEPMQQDLMFNQLAYDLEKSIAKINLPAPDQGLSTSKSRDMIQQLFIKASGGSFESNIEYVSPAQVRIEIVDIDRQLAEIKGRRDGPSYNLRIQLKTRRFQVKEQLKMMRLNRDQLKNTYENQIKKSILRTRLKIEAPDLLYDHWRMSRMPNAEEMIPLKKLDEMTIKEQEEFIAEYSRRRNSPQAEWAIDPAIDEMYEQTYRIGELVAGRLESVTDNNSLLKALEELGEERGEDRMDTIDYLLAEKWITEEQREKYYEEYRKLKIEKGRARQGLRGKILGAAAFGEKIVKKAVSLVKHQDLTDLPEGAMAKTYEEYLLKRGDDQTMALSKLRKTNLARLGLIMVNIAANIEKPILQTLLEDQSGSSTNRDGTNLVEDAYTFVSTLLNAKPAYAMEMDEEAIDDILGKSPDQESNQSQNQSIGQHDQVPDQNGEASNETEEGHHNQKIEAMTINTQDELKAEEARLPGAELISDSSTAEINAVEATNPFEFFLGESMREFQEALMERLFKMTPQEKQEFLEIMGGEENLRERTVMNLAILGKDTGGEGTNREQIYGNEGRADQILILSFDTKTGEVTVTSLDRYIKSPELNGDPINTMTWYDQEKLAQDKPEYELYSPELQRDILEHAIGLPMDAILDINFDSFVSLANTIFPNGIEVMIREGEGFYNEANFKTYEEGKTYSMQGQELLDFVRSRFTTSMFAREARAADVIGFAVDMLKQEYVNDTVERIKDNPLSGPAVIAEKIGRLNEVLDVIKHLEAEEVRDLRISWGVDYQDSSGTVHKVSLSQFMELYLMSLRKKLSDPATLANLTKLIPEFSSVKDFNFETISFSNQPGSPVQLENEGTKFVVAGKAGEAWKEEKAVSYWQPIRDFIQSKILHREIKTAAND